MSGYAVHDRNNRCTLSGAVVTRVWFKPLTEQEIAGYLATGEPFDVFVNGTLVAHGEVVVVNEKFGIRITDVVSPAERIRKLK